MKYFFDEMGRFVIESYNDSKPFSSFLPGIAGLKGIPLWVFYVNRGQCITAFGISNKDKPILEFHPAFRAYQLTNNFGFRSFIKVNGNFYEPFTFRTSKNSVQRMYIGKNELELSENNNNVGLETSVVYFTLPNERLAALVRIVTVKNVSFGDLEIELLDGMSTLLPTGINDYLIKHMGNTIRAWMDVYNLDSKIPLFRLRASTEDVARVEEIKDANFYVSTIFKADVSETLVPIVDPDNVFGLETSYSFPNVFVEDGLAGVLKRKQHTTNKIACAFTPSKGTLKPRESVEILTVVGYVPDEKIIESYKDKLTNRAYLLSKLEETRSIVDDIAKDVEVHTASQLFDEYSKQNYIDNILRGGYPIVFSEGKKVYHVYSRKHGDLERDYNYFNLLAEYYSSGNGNYRDINQNRRNDVFFNPKVGSYNIKFFVNLIQTDGYNPLVINGVRYKISHEKLGFIDDVLNAEDVEKMKVFLTQGYFTPGKIAMFIERENIKLNIEEEEFIRKLIELSEEEVDAVHGEGFWTDHWTYNLDLIESFLQVFPDHEEQLLFEEYDYTYYDNVEVVLPREKRYVLSNGKVRLYYSLVEDSEKKSLISSRKEYRNVMRTKKGAGEIYRTNLIAKLFNIALIKFATLDPDGIGIEMEAGKPGWYDALNGLPGLFGSSVAESFELARLIKFLIEKMKFYQDKEIKLPVEVHKLLKELHEAVDNYYSAGENEHRDFKFWNQISDIRERYRENTKFGFEGTEVSCRPEEIVEILGKFLLKLEDKLSKTIEKNGGIMPTYYYYEPIDYEVIGDVPNKDEKYVRIKKFMRKSLPLFLEGIVRGFKIYKDKNFLRNVYFKVKTSALYDSKLKMYKVNTSLENASIEIGRAKAFTPGWLENESIWLHMEYKYMLEVLKAGLYDEFYSDFRNVFVPFLDPKVYGRSPLENSSFIASSANPDETLHGSGFVARLSGATAEFLSIWWLMLVGESPFKFKNGKLTLEFKPALAGWLFNEEGKISFKFLGKCTVTYHNPQKIDTYKLNSAKSVILKTDSGEVKFDGGVIPEPYSKMVRDGLVKSIDVMF